jgi:hypothetical protein
MLVAREAIVINVGARPVKYGQITVLDRKSGERKTIDNHNQIVDEGEDGMPYAFKANQRVNKNHPAVKENPDAFLPADDVDEVDQVAEV